MITITKEYSEEVSEDEEITTEEVKEEKKDSFAISQLVESGKQIADLKQRVLQHELLGVAFEEELKGKNQQITDLSSEVDLLNATLKETLENTRKKLERANSSIEFYKLENILQNEGEPGTSIQQDLMKEIQIYEAAVKEKDETIKKLKHTVDLNFQLVHQIREINQMVNNAQEKVQGSGKESMSNVENEDWVEHPVSRKESFDMTNLYDSYEPETMAGFGQVREVQQLKEKVGTLIDSKIKVRDKSNSMDLPPKVQQILKDKNETISKMREEIKAMKLTTRDMIMNGENHDDSPETSVPENKLEKIMLQEQKTKQAFLENKAAEKETKKKLEMNSSEYSENGMETDDELLERQSDFDFDEHIAFGKIVKVGSVETLTRQVKRELELSDKLDKSILSHQGERETLSSGIGDCISLDRGLEDLSQHIVDRLLLRINKEGTEFKSSGEDSVSSSQVAYLQVNHKSKDLQISRSNSEGLKSSVEAGKNKNGMSEEVKLTIDDLNFKLQQEKYQVEDLRDAIQKERQQSLSLMEKLNTEKKNKSEVEEDLSSLRHEVHNLQSQLLRHQEEVEELTALYESEKSQTAVLEEALASEKKNFDHMVASLEAERQRSRDVSTRDSDRIVELRTALEVEKEQGSRLALNSPCLRTKSLHGSKLSLHGSRNSLGGQKSPAFDKGERAERLIEELMEERTRCDRLKDCLEMEREESRKLTETSEAEAKENLLKIEEKEELIEQLTRRLDTAELERCQLTRELEKKKGQAGNLAEQVELLELLVKQQGLDGKEENPPGPSAFYVEDLESKLEAYRQREEQLLLQIESGKRTPFAVATKNHQGIHMKNLPEEPGDQAVFFYRKLLRVESYRKALVWQKRYLSLLLSSYQESEMLSLGRLARMSGSRKMLVVDIPPPKGSNVRFRVVVHMMTAISRMKFLVKRWRKTKKSTRQALSQEREITPPSDSNN